MPITNDSTSYEILDSLNHDIYLIQKKLDRVLSRNHPKINSIKRLKIELDYLRGHIDFLVFTTEPILLTIQNKAS